MTRIECNCQTCKTNAAKIGKAAPLSANIPAHVVPLAKGKKAVHSFVFMANNPSAVDVAASARLGIKAG